MTCENVNVSLMAKNVTRIKSGIMINVGVSEKNTKERNVCEKDYISNAAT